MLTPRPVTTLEGDALFRHLVGHVRDYAIFLLDPGGHVVTWNQGAERIKGYREDEIVGKHFSLFFPPEDAERLRPQSVLAKAARDGRYEEESWRVRKDGSRFWASVVITALHDDETGTLIGFAKVTRDLTERKRTEEERIELLRKERLAREQAEATLASLRAAHEQVDIVESALRARTEFLSIAAHELKTPLTALKAAAQVLLRRTKGIELDAGARSGLEVVERQVNKLSLLVTHLLEIARIQGDHMSLDVRPVDVVELAREVADSIAATSGRSFEIAGAPVCSAVVDPLRIEQVMTNLLDNATKFSDPGTPIVVTIERVAPDKVRFAVRDHGPGVPPELRDRLFGQFFQGHADRSGLGLGLYISRVIVERHGGKLAAVFPPDGGSSFEATLPAGTGTA